MGPKRSSYPEGFSSFPVVKEPSGRVVVVDHEVHEFEDPHSTTGYNDTTMCYIKLSPPLPPFPLLPFLPLYPSYTSLDENRLRFDIQRQYHHIEQANSYRPFSLPSNPSKTRPTTAPTYSDPYRRDHTGVLKV